MQFTPDTPPEAAHRSQEARRDTDDSPRRSTRVIAMMNQKGGVGKTTTSVNLAAALAGTEMRVLMIDLDPQAHMSLHVGVDPAELERSVYDVLLDETTPLQEVIRHVDEGLDILPAEVNLAAAEVELADQEHRQQRLARAVRPILSQYDYVIIDCPPSLGLLTINALALAKQVVVPMQAHFLALQGLSKLLETVQLVRQSINPALAVAGVVLCMHEGQTNLAQEVINDLNQFFQASRPMNMPWSHARIFDPPIRRNIKLAECPSFGQTIFQYEPHCAGARDYERLAHNLLHPTPNTPNNPTPAPPEDQSSSTPHTSTPATPEDQSPGEPSADASQPQKPAQPPEFD